MSDKKVTLTDVIGSPLYTVYEAIDHLGWSAENTEDHEDWSTGVITCGCGREVKMSGILWISVAQCDECERAMFDATAPHMAGQNSGAASMIDSDLVEIPADGRTWVVQLPSASPVDA